MSCLFNSLSKFIDNMTSDKLRKDICVYISQNPNLLGNICVRDIVKWENGSELSDYIKNMEKSTTMGGGIEIKCFCEMYNIVVIVHHKNKEITFLPSKTSVKNIHLDYTGSHYTPRR